MFKNPSPGVNEIKVVLTTPLSLGEENRQEKASL